MIESAKNYAAKPVDDTPVAEDAMLETVACVVDYLVQHEIRERVHTFFVRLIEALEIERNVAVRSGDPDPDALAAIDADVRTLGRWINWLPERLR